MQRMSEAIAGLGNCQLVRRTLAFLLLAALIRSCMPGKGRNGLTEGSGERCDGSASFPLPCDVLSTSGSCSFRPVPGV
ncbi:hypothetical protein F5X68DRAFT_207599 [Plectosphaerella plurivora]|uniref:Uncharacterized protein n=1 Tax=Plectosphaerella plurivora TaxID=936078 RepID=A0A9P9A9Z0_9PEZI|nr:hypothetical protein F5X68DRAFT_207599 [Plectosphaerella plurivora]